MYRVFEISIFGKCYFDQNILGAPAFVKHREKIYEVQVHMFLRTLMGAKTVQRRVSRVFLSY